MTKHLHQTEYVFESKTERKSGWLIFGLFAFIVGSSLYFYFENDENEINK